MIDEVAGTHERVIVTKNGSPVAVILAVEDYESLMETLEILSDPVPARRYGPLAADPHRVGKSLRFELEGYWSARRGQSRVIYSSGRIVDPDGQHTPARHLASCSCEPCRSPASAAPRS